MPSRLRGNSKNTRSVPTAAWIASEHHRARMLVQYSDDLVDGICSIHCLGLSLGVNIDREPKGIWGPDNGSQRRAAAAGAGRAR